MTCLVKKNTECRSLLYSQYQGFSPCPTSSTRRVFTSFACFSRDNCLSLFASSCLAREIDLQHRVLLQHRRRQVLPSPTQIRSTNLCTHSLCLILHPRTTLTACVPTVLLGPPRQAGTTLSAPQYMASSTTLTHHPGCRTFTTISFLIETGMISPPVNTFFVHFVRYTMPLAFLLTVTTRT